MEHGPHTTSRRRSLPPRISQILLRVWCTVAEAVSVVGISSSRKTGGSTTLVHFMRRSSMGWNMVYVGSVTLECHPERRAQTGCWSEDSKEPFRRQPISDLLLCQAATL